MQSHKKRAYGEVLPIARDFFTLRGEITRTLISPRDGRQITVTLPANTLVQCVEEQVTREDVVGPNQVKKVRSTLLRIAKLNDTPDLPLQLTRFTQMYEGWTFLISLSSFGKSFY